MKGLCLIMESFFVSSVFWINLWTNPWKIWILMFLVFRKDSLLSMESNPLNILARTAYFDSHDHHDWHGKWPTTVSLAFIIHLNSTIDYFTESTVTVHLVILILFEYLLTVCCINSSSELFIAAGRYLVKWLSLLLNIFYYICEKQYVRWVVCHETEGEKYPYPYYFLRDSEGCIRWTLYYPRIGEWKWSDTTDNACILYRSYHLTVTKYLRFRTQRLFPKSNWRV